MKVHKNPYGVHSSGQNTENEFKKTALKVSLVSIIGNAVLSVFKMIVGIIANSKAMVSDAIHSASDVISSIIVIIGVKISSKDSDEKHPYGHERFECVAAIILAVILLVSGLFIGHTAVERITSKSPYNAAVPGLAALVAAVISIISKEAMYWYTRFYAKRLNSGALMADAWHHRSDALSSIGALIGIAGARMGFPVLDTAASLVICVFIIKAAYDIFKDATRKMVDRSCDAETENEIAGCAAEQDGVLGVDLIHTRMFGNKIYVDIEISANSRISLEESHKIAQHVENIIEEKFDKVKHIMVHVNPRDTDLDAKEKPDTK